MQTEVLIAPIDVPLFDLLKQGTIDLQKQVDTLTPAVKDYLDLPRYRDFLMRVLGFYISAEEQITEFLYGNHDPFAMQDRKKVPLMISYLVKLQVPLGEIRDIPVCGALKEINTIAELIGMLYVLECETLRWPLMQTGNGAETYRQWSQFKAAAEKILPKAEKTAAVAHARTTFIKFRNWIALGQAS